MRKKIFAAAAVMTLLAATPVFAGTWQQDQVGWYYTYDTGDYAQNALLEIDGAKYYFDANGYMVTGWRNLNGEWTYFYPDGRLARGWVQDGGKWYYLNDDGTMRVGWLNEGRYTYYLYTYDDTLTIPGAVEGAMVTGTVTLSGVTYYFDASGHQDTTMSSFTQNGINYRYREGALQWENINEKGDWIQYSSQEELAFDIQEQLQERYDAEAKTRANADLFEADARLMLPRLIGEEETESFINQVLEDMWGYRTSYSYDEEEEDYWY